MDSNGSLYWCFCSRRQGLSGGIGWCRANNDCPSRASFVSAPRLLLLKNLLETACCAIHVHSVCLTALEVELLRPPMSIGDVLLCGGAVAPPSRDLRNRARLAISHSARSPISGFHRRRWGFARSGAVPFRIKIQRLHYAPPTQECALVPRFFAKNRVLATPSGTPSPNPNPIVSSQLQVGHHPPFADLTQSRPVRRSPPDGILLLEDCRDFDSSPAVFYLSGCMIGGEIR